jgi:hypothetical protein
VSVSWDMDTLAGEDAMVRAGGDAMVRCSIIKLNSIPNYASEDGERVISFLALVASSGEPVLLLSGVRDH